MTWVYIQSVISMLQYSSTHVTMASGGDVTDDMGLHSVSDFYASV